jgi:hypothetical protein
VCPSDGAGASHALVKELDRLASRHGYQVTYSVGWELSAREKAAIGKVPGTASPQRSRRPCATRPACRRPPRPRRTPQTPDGVPKSFPCERFPVRMGG